MADQSRMGLLWTAVGALVAGLAGCAEAPPPRVPGAPGVDPAGVPEARAAEPDETGGEKMSCSANMSCAGMKMDAPKGQPHHPDAGPPGE